MATKTRLRENFTSEIFYWRNISRSTVFVYIIIIIYTSMFYIYIYIYVASWLVVLFTSFSCTLLFAITIQSCDDFIAFQFFW